MVTDILKIICFVLGTVVSLAYAYQVVYLFVPLILRRRRDKNQAEQKRYAILIAARNEEKVIGHLLDSIRQQDYPAELLHTYVVADNCTDQTAQVAKDHGATVFVRNNKEQVGKGYAVAWLLEQIKAEQGYDHFDAVVIFDADNVLSLNYMTQLNKLAAQGYQVFSGYRNTKNFGTSWISAGHSLWYIHDSAHLNHSRMLLGSGCMVTGTGYGFTRELLERLGGWPFHSLTEDIEFSTWCAVHGIKIGYAHGAMLYDEQPNTMKTSWKQRTRWSQGGIQVSLAYFKEYFKGIGKGGWSAWTCFDAFTLSLWGYGTAGLCGFLTLLTAVLSGGILGLGIALVSALLGTYFSMLFIGGLTLLTEHKKIKATTGQKLMGLFTFPLYVATFLPVAIFSVFHKYEWNPIEHTEAVSIKELQEQK